MQRWEITDRTVPKGRQGFSLIEMVIAVALIMSGLIQKARIEAARKNTETNGRTGPVSVSLE